MTAFVRIILPVSHMEWKEISWEFNFDRQDKSGGTKALCLWAFIILNLVGGYGSLCISVLSIISIEVIKNVCITYYKVKWFFFKFRKKGSFQKSRHCVLNPAMCHVNTVPTTDITFEKKNGITSFLNFIVLVLLDTLRWYIIQESLIRIRVNWIRVIPVYIIRTNKAMSIDKLWRLTFWTSFGKKKFRFSKIAHASLSASWQSIVFLVRAYFRTFRTTCIQFE